MFTIRYPRNRTELEACFALVKNSLYYDGSLTQEEVVNAWDKLLRDGVGDTLIIENSDYTGWLNAYSTRLGIDVPAFVGCMSGTYITEKYAQYLVSNKPKYVGMDFLKRYTAGENPAATIKEIKAGHAIPPDKGLHFVSYMPVQHPYIEELLLEPTEEVVARLSQYGECIRDFSLHTFGGFNIHTWFNAPIGEVIAGGYLINGQKVLWEHDDNIKVPASQKRYLLCITRDAGVSQRLGIPEANQVVLGFSFLSNQIHSSHGPAKLTPTQKKYAYLLMKGYGRDEIAKWLYAESENRNPKNSVTQLQRQVYERLTEAKYDIDYNSEMEIRKALNGHLRDIRPAIVPLYPEPLVNG